MRIVKYHDFITYCPKDGTDGKYKYDGENIDILTMITDSIAESQKCRGEIFIHTLGLSQISDIIMNDLYKLGYEYIKTEKKNEMRKGSVRYTLNDKFTFYIQIKTSGYKSFVTWQCVECVVGQQGLPETEKEALEIMKLYHYTRQRFLAGIQKAETRILYSSGTISRTMFNRENKNFSIAVQRMQGKDRLIYNGEPTPKNVICEDFSRPAVHGGFCDLSVSDYYGPGIVLDKNSLYTWVATTAYLPEPILIKYGLGMPPRAFLRDKKHYYLIYKMEITAELKGNGGIACIDSDFIYTPYLSKMKNRVMVLTEGDVRMLAENYNIKECKIISYLAFRASNTQFDGLTSLYEQKRTAVDKIHRNWAKLMQNGLIGTFAKQIYTEEIIYTPGKDGLLYKECKTIGSEEYEKRLNNSAGLCFINAAIVSEGKRRMISDIKKAGDRWIYTDTDSIHLKGQEIPDWVDIGDGLGQYKVEHVFERCSYKGRKKYILYENNKVILTVAGVPKDSLEKMEKGVPGIDYKYIEKSVRKGRITRLWRKPVPIRQLESNIEDGTISYKARVVLMDREKHKKDFGYEEASQKDYKIERKEEAEKKAEKRRKEEEEIYNIIDENRNMTPQQALTNTVSKWNEKSEEYRKKMGFEGAVAFLRRVL